MSHTKSNEVEEWLAALGQPSADRDYKPGHQRVQDLLLALEQEGFSFQRPKLRIRVAGTNGKGSTSSFLAVAFQSAGLNVGLYTSPHILFFNERISLNGKAIPQGELMSLMSKVMPLALQVGTSYFETATVLALAYFSSNQVDVEILEAGVGAKLDATTAVLADVGLLTPVALDHQAWLGDNIMQITNDKAHVFDGCSIRISVKQDVDAQQVLDDVLPDLTYAPAYKGHLQVEGEHQRINAGLAIAALDAVHHQYIALDMKKVRRSVGQMHMSGRLETIKYAGGYSFCLDAAHNPHAIEALLEHFKRLGSYFDVLILCYRDDRDLSGFKADLQVFAKQVLLYAGSDEDMKAQVASILNEKIQKEECESFMLMGSFITLSAAKTWLDIFYMPKI